MALMIHDTDWPQFAARLESLASENAAVSPPADLEAGTLRRVTAAVRRSRQRERFWLPLGAVASTLSIAAVLLVNGPGVPGRKQVAKQTKPFIQVPYVAPPAPYERLTVVRREVPLAALMAVGFRVQTPDAAATLRAELLVGQDGRPVAIRLISGSHLNRGLNQ